MEDLCFLDSQKSKGLSEIQQNKSVLQNLNHHTNTVYYKYI